MILTKRLNKKGKRLRAVYTELEKRPFKLDEAVSFLSKNSKVKFDESFEIAFVLNIDPKKVDQNIRGAFKLPHGIGKNVRVAVFAKGELANKAIEAGADIVGDDDLIQKIQGGNLDFDKCVATPDMMASIGKVAKILGPRGLMPNPKLGTVTNDVAAIISDLKTGQIEYKNQKDGTLCVALGKVSMGEEKVCSNIVSFFQKLESSKPSGIKGSFIKKATISTTMGAGLLLDHSSIVSKK